MNLVDSSAWLEYFAAGPNAAFFAPPIEQPADLLLPVIVLYEVFKRILQQRNEHDALQAVAAMQHGQIVELDAMLALEAAGLSIMHKLPMADSFILATARQFDAVIWTQDADFDGMPKVRFRAKKS
jgi:toxin FitB